MPIPLALRIANLEDRLTILEDRQRACEPGDPAWRALEADRLATLRELGLKRGSVHEQESRYALRHDIARKDARINGSAPRLRGPEPTTLGRRVGGF